MSESMIKKRSIADMGLWEKASHKRIPFSFELEITARCNNNCSHCYINLPVSDSETESKELTITEISGIADQAVEMGSLWCLLTGGEPLLRDDFCDIYIMLKQKGLMVSVFTNACLIDQSHIDLFNKYPPREIEVTVYGSDRKTYEKVTGTPGSHAAFLRGLGLLTRNGINVRMKAMAIRSNVNDLKGIISFGKQFTKDYFRFDPLLHLRYDGDPERNREIVSQRLSSSEIVEIERSDPERSQAMQKSCDDLIFDRSSNTGDTKLFYCGAGKNSFTVSPEGIFRLCPSLWQPEFIYDLRTGSLKDAWENFVPSVLSARSGNPEFHSKCLTCNIVNLCSWCPAHAYLESGESDRWSEYFCDVAHARASALQSKK